MDSFDDNQLDDPKLRVKSLSALARAHATYGLKPAHTVAHAAVDAIEVWSRDTSSVLTVDIESIRHGAHMVAVSAVASLYDLAREFGDPANAAWHNYMASKYTNAPTYPALCEFVHAWRPWMGDVRRMFPGPIHRPGRNHPVIFPGQYGHCARSTREQIYSLAGYRCEACCVSNRELLSLDHIVARSLGGRNTRENLMALCKPCNERKGSLTMDRWLETLDAVTAERVREALRSTGRWIYALRACG